jgi:hypothetical protein
MAQKLGLDPVPVIDLPEGIDPESGQGYAGGAPADAAPGTEVAGGAQAGDTPAPPA